MMISCVCPSPLHSPVLGSSVALILILLWYWFTLEATFIGLWHLTVEKILMQDSETVEKKIDEEKGVSQSVKTQECQYQCETGKIG